MEERKDERRHRYGCVCARRPAPDAQQETAEAHFLEKSHRQASRDKSNAQIRARREADDARAVEPHEEHDGRRHQPYASQPPDEERAPRQRAGGKQFAHRTPLGEPPQQRSYKQDARPAERHHHERGPLGSRHAVAQRHRHDGRHPQQGESQGEPACGGALFQYLTEVHKCPTVVLRSSKIVKGERQDRRKHAFFLDWPSRSLSSRSKDSERRAPKQEKACFFTRPDERERHRGQPSARRPERKL